MGICYDDARLFLEAQRRGVSFERVLTLGHQEMYLRPSESRRIGLADYKWGTYADDFFRYRLCTQELEILDNSDYEGATLVHDLNVPVPTSLWGRYDVIVDGGSLEHVFNFPVAVASLMRMLRVGGTIFVNAPANNLCGHGFYQFSPELMFRVFSPENGFSVRSVLLLRAKFPGVELTRIREIYEVTDPALTGNRVGLMTKEPITMRVEATKTAEIAPFASAPQQSDYVVAWKGERKQSSGLKAALKRLLARLPAWVQHNVRGHYMAHRFSFANRHAYRRLR